MNFKALSDFQDSLIDLGIGGNDCAVYVDGKQVYRHFSGWQNLEEGIKINDKTVYRMFSMTKPITCVAAMQLFEKGGFLLNDPVSDYLPEFANMKIRKILADGTETFVSAQKPMLVQHLFEMSAGLDYVLDAPPLLKLKEETNNLYTTREAARAIAQKPLLFEPGEHWFYSLGHDVIGALIEVISGEKFGDYLKNHIFEPLGMRESGFEMDKILADRICHRYGFDENGKFVRGCEENQYRLSKNFESGGAGLSMTVDDYARFACAMTNRGVSKDGVRILAGRTVDLMRTNRLNQTQLDDLWRTPGRAGYGWGLGVRTLYSPAVSGSATPIGEFGWGGAWGTYVIMDPSNKVTVVYAEQGVDTKGPYIQRRIRNIAYAALEYEGFI